MTGKFGRLGRGLAFALAACATLSLAPALAQAQDQSEQEIERYRKMLADPFSNPALLNVDRGEELWKKARGDKNVSLEQCDLGEGPGKLEGAYAKLPRYFADADRVMDLEQRLLYCMETLQGFDTANNRKKAFSPSNRAGNSEMEDLVAYIAEKSTGHKFQISLEHPKEKEMFAVGRELFYRRSAISDFSCATCHGEPGKRIRLQGLPRLDVPGKDAQVTQGTWPTYRVSQSQMRTMQHRLNDCYRQMRMPKPEYASDGLTALNLFLNKMADGGEINVPSVKR